MAELVSEIYDEVLSPRQGQVTIRPLVKPNSLLLIGRPESVDIVKTLITKLDQPVKPETQFEVFPLKHISALDAEETIDNFFVDGLGESTQGGQIQGLRPGLGTRVNVVAEYRSNALIVQASPSDMNEVRRLLERIDVETTSASNELRIFRLKNALATDIAPVLQDALNWQLIGNRTPVGASQSGTFGGQAFGAGQQEESARLRSAILTFMTIDSDGGKILESGILSEVRVTADTNGNSLLVTGPAKSMGLIEVLVKELDTLPSAKAEIKVFTIVNGDAATLAQMLQQLLAENAQTNQGGTLFGQGNLNPFLQPGMQTAASLGESTLVPIRFGVDQRTNSIIATGTEGDLGVVEAILLRLDEESYLEHRTMVYWLANAPAVDVAAAVDEWLDDRQALYDDQLQLTPQSPDIQWNRQVIVVPEAISNSIIISATPALFDEVKHVVETLDRKRPLIKIDVLIAEVGLGDIYEFGAEFGLQDGLLFDRAYAAGGEGDPDGPGYNFNNVPLGDQDGNRDALLGQALSTFGLGRISSEGYGGLVLSASKDSISILLRALQEDSRVQILSRPTITTLDSQPATVFVGENTARPGGAIQNASTTTTNVTYENVGLQMLVTPQVRPDGTIVMDIDTTKSRLDFARSVEINGDEIPNIATINAATTVSARSGQTVAFAGLIETNLQQQVRGIPYVSDLPVLGPLLSYTKDQETRTELLIILTPHLIEDESQLDTFRYSESERMSWCLADVMELYGNAGLSSRPGNWCPCGGCGTCDICRGNGATPVIFPDMNPTGIIEPIESDAVPLPPEPADQEGVLLPPPVHTSSIQSRSAAQANLPWASQHNQAAYGPAQPGQPVVQYPAMTAGYEGSNASAAGPAAFHQDGTAGDSAARRLPPSGR
jgi:type II secretory pathway component GspD/PulD (secretin)